MSKSIREEEARRADARLAQLLTEAPGLAVDKNQVEWLRGTNFIKHWTFDGKPVVLKYFDWQPRKAQEEKALRLFEPTGCVPNRRDRCEIP